MVYLKKSAFLLTLLFIPQFIFAQEFSSLYKYEIEQPIFQLIDKGDAEYYLSASGNYLIINTNQWIKVVSEGRETLNYDYISKTNAGVGAASRLVGGQGGRLISNFSFNEGTAFWLFEEEDVIVTLDWNVDKNLIMGFELSSGKKLWEIDQFRYTPGKNEQLATALASAAASAVAYESLSAAAIVSANVFKNIQYDMNRVMGYGSAKARAFITPLEGTSSFMLAINDGLTCIDLKTGEKKWEYTGYPITIGEHKMVPGEEEVLLVNFNPGFFKKSENLIIKLDTETGEELLRIEHITNFLPERTYVEGDRLILDYYGAEVYDLNSGERIFTTLDEEIMDKNVLFPVPGTTSEEFYEPNPHWIANGKLFGGKGRVGRKTYPNMNVCKDITYYAYDLESGEKLWETETETKVNSIAALSEGKVITKDLGIGKSEFRAFDQQTGELTAGPVKVKQNMLIDERKPWLFFSGEHMIHNGKKELYFFDKETLQEEHALKTSKAKAGDLHAMDLYKEGILMVGDKGAAFSSKTGDLMGSVKIKDVQSAAWNDDYLLVFTEGTLFSPGEINIVDLKTRKLVNSLEQSDIVLFSPNLKYWIMIDEKKNTEINAYAIQ